MNYYKKSKERIKKNGEIFTPTPLVNEILDRLSKESHYSVWKENKTFCDPSCGNGNFLVEILIRKLNKGHNPLTALSTIFGVDIMVDSIQECKERLLNVLKERNIEITKKMIDVIQNNIICLSLDKYPRGSLDYDFSFNNLTKT